MIDTASGPGQSACLPVQDARSPVRDGRDESCGGDHPCRPAPSRHPSLASGRQCPVRERDLGRYHRVCLIPFGRRSCPSVEQESSLRHPSPPPAVRIVSRPLCHQCLRPCSCSSSRRRERRRRARSRSRVLVERVVGVGLQRRRARAATHRQQDQQPAWRLDPICAGRRREAPNTTE